MMTGEKMSKQKVVLITGASSGFGMVTAALLAEKGYRVFGTSRNPAKSVLPGFEMLPLDVRSDDSSNACVRRLMERAGRLDVLINNAGYEITGALEETSIPEAKAQFETNFFGAARMVKAVLPIMRTQKSGQIINMGSLSGLISLPFLGFYSASKHALEGYTEALRHEVKRFNIRVSIIEPSFFKTNLASAGQSTADFLPDYSEMRRRVTAVFERSVQTGDDPNLVARLVLAIVESKSPRLRYRVGKTARWLPRIRAVVSESAFEAGLRRNFHLDG